MHENELSKIIVNTAFEIHNKLGPGLFESVYEEIMYFELLSKGLKVERQVAVPVYWKDIKMEVGFRADLIVEGKVIIELKCIATIGAVFSELLIKDGITRIVNNL